MKLFTDEADCCGCEACVNICPKQAITMETNGKGFLYPVVDTGKCIHCNRCVSVCKFKSPKLDNTNIPEVYAAVNQDKTDLRNSASGGAFSALARYVLEHDGVVFGCAWDEKILPYHLGVNSMEDLEKLQGSKYVQSRIGNSYKDVKYELESGRMVLFSGTPCQCEGLRSYLGKEYEKLICAELICHGVPSAEFWKSYLTLLERQLRGKILDIKFRDKKRGWGALLHIVYKDAKENVKHKYLSTGESYYYYYYWGGELYRDSCYHCKYASLYRQSDYTIGDYWGIQKAHPALDASDGVSVLLVNTDKGKALLPDLQTYMKVIPSTLEAATKENGQLVAASSQHLSADRLWKLYEQGGAKALEEDYKVHYISNLLKGKIKRHVPLVIKERVKKLIMK